MQKKIQLIQKIFIAFSIARTKNNRYATSKYLCRRKSFVY